MFFSIIIPVYNAEKTIKRCLDSVLEQGFEDFEVILVNDGSLDNSSIICQQYADRDSRVKYIEQNNKGVSEARNTGIKVAEGKYLCFLDSDAVYYKYYLKTFYKVILKYPQVDNYWCRYDCLELDEDYKKKESPIDFVEEVSFWGKDTIMSLHEKALDGAPWNKIYRRTTVVDNNICFDKNVSLGEDMMFNYDYLDKTSNKIVLIDVPIYGYYCGSMNSLNNNLGKIYTIFMKN